MQKPSLKSPIKPLIVSCNAALEVFDSLKTCLLDLNDNLPDMNSAQFEAFVRILLKQTQLCRTGLDDFIKTCTEVLPAESDSLLNQAVLEQRTILEKQLHTIPTAGSEC